jgi:hypothetical protein
MLDKATTSDEEGKKVDGGNRIFHQDAYCAICDREFCNKYFLKTHRANKHGIFGVSGTFTLGSVAGRLCIKSITLNEDDVVNVGG